MKNYFNTNYQGKESTVLEDTIAEEQTHIDIQQRKYDQQFIVWERMYCWKAGDDTYLPETQDEFRAKIPPYARHKLWVPVTVCRKKSEAVDYCRDRFGRNCFKDNDKVKVAFT